MSVATLPAVEERTQYEFTLNDRCDGDDGFVRNDGRGVTVAEQAYHLWTKGTKTLLLCNHHNAKHEDALMTSGWEVQRSPVWDKLDQPIDINQVD